MSKKYFFQLCLEPVLYDDHSPYKLMTEKLHNIQIDCFLGQKSLGGRVVNELPLDMDIKQRILKDFISYGNGLIASQADEIEKEIVEKARNHIESYPNRKEVLHDLCEAMGDLKHFVDKQLCFVPTPMYDTAELRELYAAAKRVTLLERVSGNNDKDVFSYYHALVEHTVWACRMLMRRRTGQYLMHMADVLSQKFKTA